MCILGQDYQQYLLPLTQISRDRNNGVSLCQSDKRLYGFDYIKKKLCKRKNSPASFDGLFVKDKKIYCVEFKNTDYGKPVFANDPEAREKEFEGIRNKYVHGLQLLEVDLGVNLAEFEIFFYVVFKKTEKESRQRAKGFANELEMLLRSVRSNVKVKIAQVSNFYREYRGL